MKKQINQGRCKNEQLDPDVEVDIHVEVDPEKEKYRWHRLELHRGCPQSKIIFPWCGHQTSE